MNLQEEISAARSEIRTDSYAVSIGEWISLYEKSELDIHPEFQRFFRWSREQKSRLVESILLGIPIPPIFVAQREDGVWDVVDGLQRLSTIFELVGVLRDESGKLVEPLRLTKTAYLPSLEGKYWSEDTTLPDTLSSSERLLIKRAKLDVSIILRESEEKTKYELFQRLNTGGSQLSDQEVRNAIMVMLDPDLYRWMSDLAMTKDFVEVVALSDRGNELRTDMELVLRFLALRKSSDDDLTGIGDVGEFLTSEMRAMAGSKKFQRGEEERAFRATFGLLNRCLGSDAFRKWDSERKRSVGGFSVSAFETVALGIGFDPFGAESDCTRLSSLIHGIWEDPEFLNAAGSGVRASSRLPKIVPYGRLRFRA